MRKMKKINGYLIVRFNDRERREYEELGAFGVIDAEIYTGSIDIDRGEMEYDDAETIEQAVEQARGLDSEEDYTRDAPSYAVIEESKHTYHEEPIEPKELVREWGEQLSEQIDNPHCPSTNFQTAAHEFNGFLVALNRLGILDADDAAIESNRFCPATPQAGTFRHAKQGYEALSRKMYALGVKLGEDCPANDCTLYLNIFNMVREIDEQLDRVTDYPWIVLQGAFRHEYFELEQLYRFNSAVKDYRHSVGDVPCSAPEKPYAEPEPSAPSSARQIYHFHCKPNEITDRELVEMATLYDELFLKERSGDLQHFFETFERCVSLDQASGTEQNNFVRPHIFNAVAEELRSAWKLYYKSPEICAYLREQEKAKKEPPAEQTTQEPVSDPDRYEEIEKKLPVMCTGA